MPSLKPNPISVESNGDLKEARGWYFQVKVQLTGASNHLSRQHVLDIAYVPGTAMIPNNLISRCNCPPYRAEDIEAGEHPQAVAEQD